jgi:hypothetical protein
MGLTRRRLAAYWVAAVLLTSLLAASSALASSRHVTLTARGPSRVALRGLAVVTGRARPASGVRVELQERRGGWHLVKSGRTGSGGTFVLPVRARAGQSMLTLRVLALKKGHRVAMVRVPSVRVKRGAPTTASSGTSATVVPASTVTSLPSAGQSGNVVLSGSHPMAAGTVIATGTGPNSPDGFLGKVRSSAVSGGRTVVQTVPATIQEALPAGSFSLDQATRVGGIRRADRDQTGRTSSDDDEGTFNHDLSKALKCEDGAEFDATGSVGLSSRPRFSVAWSLLHGVSASFTETVSASASLSGTVSGAAKCTFDKTAVLAHPAELGTFAADVLGVPVVVAIQGQIYLDGDANANGSVSAGINGSVSASGGIAYAKGHASVLSPSADMHFATEGPTVQATAGFGAHVTPELRLLLYGVGGPVFDAETGLDFSADISKNPWWTLTSPLKVTASLQAPDFDLSTPDLTLYDRTFQLAKASGTFPGTNPPGGTTTTPPPPLTIPQSGPTLIDEEDTAGNPDTGDQTFSEWSDSAGQDADVEDALPASLSSYRCVVLDINQSLQTSDTTQLAAYLQAGGTVVALGEHDGLKFDTADATLNTLAQTLGSGLSLDDNEADDGDTYTYAIKDSPLTAGVESLGENDVSTIEVPAGAQALVDDSADDAPIVGAQTIGAGTLVMSGDSNMFSDNNDGFYAGANNGVFVTDLCP